MPASPVSVAELQYYLKDASTDTAYLAFLSRLLDATTDIIYSQLRRDFTSPLVINERFFGTGRDRYFPLQSYGPINLLSVLEINFAGDSDPIAVTQFFVGPDNYIFWKTSNFRRDRWYFISYTLTQTVPEAVRQVITEMAYELIESGRRGMGALNKETDYSNVLGQSSLRYRNYADLDKRWQLMLTAYVNYTI